MYNASKITFSQYEKLIDNAPPRFLSPVLYTMNQQIGMWKQRVMQEKMTMGITKLCAWKYLTSGWRNAQAKSPGISQTMNFPASCEIRGS